MNHKNPLTQKRCQPCEGSGQPFSAQEAEKHLLQVHGWELRTDNKGIFRNYTTKNFMAAIAFIQKIADLAEAEDHHPDLHLTGYRHLRVDLSTHAIGGLSENDFILASKINELPVELKS